METEYKLSDKDELETRQILADSDREDVKLALLDEERRKHELVEKVLGMLASEGIYAYLYADLPNNEVLPGIPCVYQFNTLQAFMKYDDDGNRIEDLAGKNAFFHSGLWKSIVDTLIYQSNAAKLAGIDRLDPRDPKTHSKRMNFLVHYVTYCYQDYQDRCFEIYDNPV